MYHILFYHWVYDDHVYRDEQQRHYVDTGILMASYFGCRPVSMFDTRIKFEDDDDNHKPVNGPTVAGIPEDTTDDPDWDDGRSTLVDSDSDLDDGDDGSTCSGGDTGSDSGTDDEVDAGRDKTGTLLWRHIIFLVAPHQIVGEPNVLFAKVTIVHTKGEDNCPREYVPG